MKRLTKSSIVQIMLCAALIGAFAGFISQLPASPQPNASLKAKSDTQTFQAVVINVSDGDSITVRSGDQNIKIRLAEIDAPERGQPWGTKSRQELAGLVAGKTVSITPQGQDRYDRIIAKVEVNGLDINRAMVQRGAAWAYDDYVSDLSITQLQAQARSERTGLWAMPAHERQPPWEYRAERRKAASAAVGR